MNQPPKHPITTASIEYAVAQMMDWRRNIIVPNVSWGLNIHECDLLVVRKSGFAIEVEIKTSAADIRADKKKRHGHRSVKIKELYFAVPYDLADNKDIPERAGIIAVSRGESGISRLRAVIKREPKINADAHKLTEQEIAKVMHLGCMRIWRLKELCVYNGTYWLTTGRCNCL